MRLTATLIALAGSFEIRQASATEALAADPLREFFTFWTRVTAADVAALRAAIERAEREEDIQQHLQERPLMLVQHLGGGHGRWVIPKLRLGSAHVTDFVIGDRDSGGRRWFAVELESPKHAMFTRGGDPSRYLTHAIRQIADWRAWLTTHHASAVTPREKEGLGLEDVEPQLPGLILIGRRGLGPNPRERRRQFEHDHRLEIHSYDWLVERAEEQVAAYSSQR